MPSKKRGNNKKKNGGGKKKENHMAISVGGVESKENFALRISEYKIRNHGVIISPKPSIVAMKVAAEAGRKMKIVASGTTPATDASNNNKYTEFLCHCGKRVEDILEYDIKTNMVDARLLIDEGGNNSNSAVMIKVPSQALIEELTSFPNQNETTRETIDRLLQYEFTSQSVDITEPLPEWRSSGPSCKIYKVSDAPIAIKDVMSMKVGAMKSEH